MAEYPGDAMSYDAWKLRNPDDDRELQEGRQYVESEHCRKCGSDDRVCNHPDCPYARPTVSKGEQEALENMDFWNWHRK